MTHPMEVLFLVVAFAAAVESLVLFLLKVSDLLKARSSRQNGPILFAVSDNLRRQGFTLLVSGVLVGLSWSSYHNHAELSPQARSLMTGLILMALAIIVEGGFIYRRRGRMKVLIATYEGRPGGRRITDPPSLP